MAGFFKKLFTKFSRSSRIDWEELEAELVAADIGIRRAMGIADQLKESKGLDAENLVESTREVLRRAFPSTAPSLPAPPEGKPLVILVVGVNGTGKTTSAAKLAHLLQKQGSRVLLAAADTFRAAAVEQLQSWADKLNIPICKGAPSQDPASVCYEAHTQAIREGFQYLICDTAGRLHTRHNLMEELSKIRRTLAKQDASAPHSTLLVVDAMTGQDAVNAATAFDEALGIDGVVLTKLDGDARGGAALSIKAATGKPIKFVGTGEKLDMIEPFHPDRMASRILGMGDMLSFIEKAQQTYDENQAAKLEEKLRKNRLTLQDYYEQLQQLRNMGDLSQIASMMPGALGRQMAGATIDDKALAHTEAIILSMTPLERENPQILNASRKKRIAAGCGLEVVDVNRLLKQFDMMQQLTKQMTRGRLSKMGGGGLGSRMHGFGRKKRLK